MGEKQWGDAEEKACEGEDCGRILKRRNVEEKTAGECRRERLWRKRLRENGEEKDCGGIY